MNISEAFIRRPVAATLLTVGTVLAGALAVDLLTVSPGSPGSHRGRGWEQVTDRAIGRASCRERVYLGV